MKKLLLALIIIPALMLSLQSCEEEASDYFNFKIIASGDEFSGYYWIDGGDEKYFTGDQVSGTTFYEYSVTLDNPESVYIFASRKSTNISSISIYVYQNEEMVANATESKGDGEDHVTVELSHNFDKGDDDDDDSSD